MSAKSGDASSADRTMIIRGGAEIVRFESHDLDAAADADPKLVPSS
jgi:hypothetical protein